MSRRVRLEDVPEPVRFFLDDALAAGGVLIEGDAGQLRGRLLPYEQLSHQERERAWQELRELQARVQQRLHSTGKTEAELDEILQDDD